MARNMQPKNKKGNTGRSGKGKQEDRRGSRDSRYSKEKDTELRGEASGTEHRYNDVSWYAKNDNMLRDSASFSYNNPLGNTIPWAQITGTAYSGLDSVPGLMSLVYVPGIGFSSNSASPANLAAQNIYTYVRYMNSGAKNYDQADLMLYLLALDSIYTMWNWAKRVYGYARTYSTKNNYLPTAFAAADGVNLDSIVGNMADFRMRLNSLAAQISSFCVPAVMPLFVRHSWLASNLYADSYVSKAQLYQFVPGGYYVYDETGNPNGGQLLFKQTPPMSGDTYWTYSKICDVIKSMLDAVAYSEDIGVMSGDILKAYGQDKLFKITPLEPDYMVAPVYNEEVLNQIHNSTFIGSCTTSTLNVTQDPTTGFLIYKPEVTQARVLAMDGTKYMLNMPWEEVTPANNMVGSRLTAGWSVIGSGDTAKNLLTCVGSEFITARKIYYRTSAGALSSLSYQNYLSVAQGNSEMTTLAALSQFDWHPITPLAVASGSTISVVGVLGDISNYTIVDQYNLEAMHTTALLSEFNVPQIGSY